MSNLYTPQIKLYKRNYYLMSEFKTAMCNSFCTDDRKCRSCQIHNLSEFDYEAMPIKELLTINKEKKRK